MPFRLIPPWRGGTAALAPRRSPAKRVQQQALCAWLSPPNRRGRLLEGSGLPRYIYHQVAGRQARPGGQPMHDVVEAAVAPKLKVTPLSDACGAEISGVDLSKPLSRAEVEAIKDAWGKHLVLVFRGQEVSQDDQLRFASYFGDLGIRKKAPEALRGRNEGTVQEANK